MKKLPSLFLTLLLTFSIFQGTLSQGALPQEEPLPQQVDLYYFYDEICGSCDNTDEFDALVAEELADVRDTYPLAIYRYNVYKSLGQETFDSLCEKLALDQSSLELPLVIIGGKVFQGHESMGKNLKEAYLTAGEDLFTYQRVYNPALKKTGPALFEDYTPKADALTLVYFYRITCQECNKTKPVIDEIITAFLADNPDTPVDVVLFNARSGNNSERVSAFFSAYQVPDDKRMVPIVFLADTYLAGVNDISAQLLSSLDNSRGKAFAYPKGQ